MNELAAMQLHSTLTDLLRKPPPTPPPGREQYQVRWYNPASRRLTVERFAREREAMERFREVMGQPRGTRFRLEVVERVRGGRWETRSTLKDGAARGTTARIGPGVTSTGRGTPAAPVRTRTYTRAEREAILRTFSTPRRPRVHPTNEVPASLLSAPEWAKPRRRATTTTAEREALIRTFSTKRR